MNDVKGYNRNRATMISTLFTRCCEKAKLQPTKRQASKFSRHRGKAYQYKNEVQDEMIGLRRENPVDREMREAVAVKTRNTLSSAEP